MALVMHWKLQYPRSAQAFPDLLRITGQSSVVTLSAIQNSFTRKKFENEVISWDSFEMQYMA